MLYRHSRKNCSEPETGRLTCHWLPLKAGAFVSVFHVPDERLDLDWTEKPAAATGQLNRMLPLLVVTVSDGLVVSN